jgi:MFS family permease
VTAAAPPAPAPALFSRDFTLFLVSLCAATLAMQIQATSVGYQLFELTRDPLSLGLVGLAEALPFISLALVGGHVADRRDRRRIVVLGFAIMSLCAAGLLLLSQRARRSGADLTPALMGAAIYAAIVVGGVCRAFLQPARIALSAQIVPRQLYPRAIAWRTGVFQLGAIAGPAAGGLLYGWVGARGAYLAALGLFLVACASMAAVRPPPRAAGTGGVPTSFTRSIREGLRYVVGDKLLLPAITLDLFAVLFGGAVALLPVFAEEILKVGPRGFGLLRAAPAAGAVIASAVLAFRPPLRKAGRAMLLSVAAFGLCMIGFALSRSFVLSLLLLGASGAMDMVSVLVRSTLLQLRVPEHMLGRVSSINQIFIGSSNEIGAFESGVAARLVGTVPSVVLGGMVTLAVVGVISWKAPALRRLGALSVEPLPPAPPPTP